VEVVLQLPQLQRRLCELAIIEEQEFGGSNFPAIWVQT
jgi:hypothetical protein